jgi:hypothetical protein
MSGAQPVRAASRASAARVDVTLIDGPGFRDGAFHALDIGRSIEGVLLVVPKGTRKLPQDLAAEIEARIGHNLVGLVSGEG